jgi:hypothetical protein
MFSFHRYIRIFMLAASILLPKLLYSQPDARSYSLNWSPLVEMRIKSETVKVLHFQGASYELNTLLPNFYEVIKIANNSEYEVELKNPVFQSFDPEELREMTEINELPEDIQIRQSYATLRKEAHLQVSISPVRRNAASGVVEVLSSFSLQLIPKPVDKKSGNGFNQFHAEQSLLSSGTWIKIKIEDDGIYRLSYEELIGMGLGDPASVRLYGYGEGMLPLDNMTPRYDDLRENAIYMEKGSDDKFGPNDFILFHGRSPHIWKYDEQTKFFQREIHAYSDYNYYFLTSDLGSGKQITDTLVPAGSPDLTVSTFDEHIHYELDDINVIKSGREWYGEHFDINTNQTFPFSIPGLVMDDPLRMKVSVIARATDETSYQIYADQQSLGTIKLAGTSFTYSAPFARAASDTFAFITSSSDISINLRYLKNAPSAEGWLNFISLNARRDLDFSNDFLYFRDSRSVSQGQVCEFSLSGASSSTRVWDVTNPTDVKGISGILNGNTFLFKTETSLMREFVAFDMSGSFLKPEYEGDDVGIISNQNLHALRAKNYVVISHPDFLSQARQLAAYRHDNDGLDTVVVTPGQIYNEFSSGTPDVSAIRDFLKMLYDRAGIEDEIPKYVLLFGDGSYDNKGTGINNTNFIPTYQSLNSISQTGSFVTDDFFGLLDDDEGGSSGMVDIGIGRFPVSTLEEATNLLNKTISYDRDDRMGDWRNSICFIGDDEDGNLHMRQADELAQYVESQYPDFTIGKIYLDAYSQVSTPSGARYPDVNEALNQRISKGALIINYTGHGGATGLAHERILTIDDVVSWDNAEKLPLFMTATCEFSRFDEYESTSAGEMVLLNPQGGGIALLTTTRLVYAGPNHELNERFYEYVFEKNASNENHRLGDIIRLTKNASTGGINKRNFTLLGDPAIMLAYPKNKVRVTSINGRPVSGSLDTLKALSRVTVSGLVENQQGTLMSEFNGILYPAVYDKNSSITTLSNDGNPSFQFSLRNRLLYKGKATVNNGIFNFSFIVPKDIAYNYGYGKFSFYSSGSKEDASGSFDQVTIGGSADSVNIDTEGPVISLYMNDQNFVFGGMTDSSPELLVFASDSNGVNTIGSGIGHDITAILDQDASSTIVLNDYYEADTDSYQSGKVRYPLNGLEAGNHSLKVKVWDVYNNSSEEVLEFIVNTENELVLSHVLNYPNPFTTHTQFFFEHNQADQDLYVLIHVFTVTGKLVKTIEKQVPSSGYRTSPIDWDGLDDFGSRIGRGVYIYRVKVRSALGHVAEKYEKLVILR